MITRMVMVLFVIAVIAAVVLGVALMVHTAKRRSSALPAPDDPREILRRRYAAGEIDEDEYLRRMSGLSQDW
ncbi:hypothetical protein Pta02_57210 [Planobispora takensis]|uniref:SHOCT domain-containing protein n=2 Tax=Planobispora takensis TaxID=1367882 RepID=A0A8J3WWE6_9ACTN|nr:hypothetical protein Pta02_57210 [Planobispora takensis]